MTSKHFSSQELAIMRLALVDALNAAARMEGFMSGAQKVAAQSALQKLREVSVEPSPEGLGVGEE